MFQLEPFKLTPIPASRRDPIYVLGNNPRNARVMAFDQVGSGDVNYAFRWKCSRVKNIKEMPADVQKAFADHQRDWKKFINKRKKAAVDAIFAKVANITKQEAEAVVNEIMLKQIPNVSWNVFGALRK